MSEKTKIVWADSTVNFWSGCAKVSPGCANCYAEDLSNRKLVNKAGELSIGQWGKGAPRRLHESAFKLALKLNKKPWVCDACGAGLREHEDFHFTPENENGESFQCANRSKHRRRIFSLSLGDWLDPEVPIEWLARMLDTIRQCDQVTWILCTKRPESWEERLKACRDLAGDKDGSIYPETEDNDRWWWLEHWLTGEQPPKNIILLISVENQAMADKRIPELLKIPAACRGLSLEPLLGPVDLVKDIQHHSCAWHKASPIACLDWIIIGGESGPKARPCNEDWIRDLVRQGKAAGVATLVKQTGSHTLLPSGVRLPIKDKKGSDPSEWPEDLRVQEWPKGFDD